MTGSRMTAVFTGGLRTAFGRAHKGGLKDIRPDDLLAGLFREHASRNAALFSEGPEDVIVGCGYPEGEQGYNVARMASLGAGLKVPGITVNRLCGSSLDAVGIAAARIRAGYGEVFLTGGVESMSRIPRRGAGFSESDLVKKSVPRAYVNMGETAEEVARRFPGISRGRQEDFAARSHELAHKAYENGFYADQVVTAAGVERDELLRYPADREKMAALKPAFSDDGVVTAATSSPLTDGATSGWVVSEERARKLGVRDGLVIRDVAWSQTEPEVMGLGPVEAVKKLLGRNGIGPRDLAAVEVNEAFAIQVLACLESLGMDDGMVNLKGGAIALGHPLGASGLRLMMTLQGRLRETGRAGALGVATLCVGGGQGVACLAEWVKFD